MQRANFVVAGLFITGTLASAAPGRAQTTVGADLGLFSSYVWRGLSLTNKPVAQPDVYVTIPAGNASITAGGWANFDLGKYDNASDISESGGTSAFNFAEFDPWLEVGIPVGKATLTAGRHRVHLSQQRRPDLRLQHRRGVPQDRAGRAAQSEAERLLRCGQGEGSLRRGKHQPLPGCKREGLDQSRRAGGGQRRAGSVHQPG